jgi:hypothetical protein
MVEQVLIQLYQVLLYPTLAVGVDQVVLRQPLLEQAVLVEVAAAVDTIRD